MCAMACGAARRRRGRAGAEGQKLLVVFDSERNNVRRKRADTPVLGSASEPDLRARNMLNERPPTWN
jgi:hypothetical protein